MQRHRFFCLVYCELGLYDKCSLCKVTIEGRLLTKNTEYAVYVTDEEPGDAGDKTLTKRVEDVALAHYRENGYPEGMSYLESQPHINVSCVHSSLHLY